MMLLGQYIVAAVSRCRKMAGEAVTAVINGLRTVLVKALCHIASVTFAVGKVLINFHHKAAKSS